MQKKFKTYIKKVIYITPPIIKLCICCSNFLEEKRKEKKNEHPTSTSSPGSCLLTWFAAPPSYSARELLAAPHRGARYARSRQLASSVHASVSLCGSVILEARHLSPHAGRLLPPDVRIMINENTVGKNGSTHACGGWSGNRALEGSLALACKIEFALYV